MAAIAAPAPRGANARRRVKLNILRSVIFVVLGFFFLLPLYAMAEFTTRGVGENSPRSLAAWETVVTYPGLMEAIITSLGLAAITSTAVLLLLVPTMIWVRLRLTWLRPIIEFLCLLPLAIPAIVLVVGLAPVYRWVTYIFGDSSLTLAFAYVILALPYTYRVLDAGLSAIDVRTLSEAARSLGADWPMVMLRVVAPNMSGALLNAGVLSVALVLGEFTVASLLSFQNLQVAIYLLGRVDARVSIAVAVGSLLFTFVLLVGLSLVGSQRRGVRTVDVA